MLVAGLSTTGWGRTVNTGFDPTSYATAKTFESIAVAEAIVNRLDDFVVAVNTLLNFN